MVAKTLVAPESAKAAELCGSLVDFSTARGALRTLERIALGVIDGSIDHRRVYVLRLLIVTALEAHGCHAPPPLAAVGSKPRPAKKLEGPPVPELAQIAAAEASYEERLLSGENGR